MNINYEAKCLANAIEAVTLLHNAAALVRNNDEIRQSIKAQQAALESFVEQEKRRVEKAIRENAEKTVDRRMKGDICKELNGCGSAYYDYEGYHYHITYWHGEVKDFYCFSPDEIESNNEG